MSEFVSIPNNQAPESAEIFYFHDSKSHETETRQMRGMFVGLGSRFTKSRGTVIICPGRSEFIEKYFEVARDMQERGFCSVLFDWPGQGLSYRFTDDKLAGHVDNFETYINALRHGLNAIEDKMTGPLVLLAHSMGGAIALEALRQHVLEVDAAAFSAPLWGLKISKLTHPLIKMMNLFGKQSHLVMRHNLDEVFEGNIVSNNEERWRIQHDLIKANSDLALGSITWGWVQSVLDVTKDFMGPMALDHLTMPVLVASASEEALVDNKSHALLAARLKGAQHITVEGAKHEILMETENRRAQFFTAFDKMLDRAGI